MLNTTQSQTILIAFGSDFSQLELVAKLKARGIDCLEVSQPQELAEHEPAVIILNRRMLSKYSIEQWREGNCATLFAEEWVTDEADLIVSNGFPEKQTIKLLELACHQWALKRKCLHLESHLESKQINLNHLASIGIALSAEKDLNQLLSKILTEGQKLSVCDAASLFLVSGTQGKLTELVFKLTQNNSTPVPFKEFRFPISNESIVGHVAINNININIADVYCIPESYDLQFDRSFDKTTGYRTKSIIAIPMVNHRQEVIGVLEFINKKIQADINIARPEDAEKYVVPFDESDLSVLHALASQAAVAIENKVLIDKVNELFDGFVKASVTAIEQRDPTTSGHSFRVADFSTHLARALPQSNHPQLSRIIFSPDEVRELRYAALLHDFGKVGVREHVLIKAKKLMPERLETLHYRIALVKERLQTKAYKDIVNLYESNAKDLVHIHNQITRQLEAEMARLDGFIKAIFEANEPTILAEGNYEHLQEIIKYPFMSLTDKEEGLIDNYDFLALSVRKGSLTEHERKEIESHVVHTFRFLNLIPWTPELARIPEIAGAHHEKLDGSGYPDNKEAHEIPLASKIMTIADIFDALTASDRPYKRAMPKDRALAILEDEARRGLLDQRLVNIFIDAKVYDIDVSKVHSIESLSDYDGSADGSANSNAAGYAHHVCDVNLPDACNAAHAHNTKLNPLSMPNKPDSAALQ